MAYVGPGTWAANDLITAAKLNQDVRDNVSFLATPPSCRVFNSANISHATSGATQFLTFNSERWDSQTLHSTSSLTGRITMPVAGKYLVGGNISFASNTTGVRTLNIRVNGTTTIANYACLPITGGVETPMFIETLYSFSASDYVELGCLQSSGGALNVLASGNYSPEFWALWVSL